MPKIACFPIASLKEPRFFELPPLHQYVYVRMFFCADTWGRLPNSVRGIAQETWQSLELVEEALPNLLAGDRPLIHAYVVNGSGYLQLDQHDARQEIRFLSRRAQPMHPDPPPDVWENAGCRDACRTRRDEREQHTSEPDSDASSDNANAVSPQWPPNGPPHTEQSIHSTTSPQAPGPGPLADQTEGRGGESQKEKNDKHDGHEARTSKSNRAIIASLIEKVRQ
jgi:hypothetical protein